MKTAVCLTAIVACLTLCAQETPRPASGGLAERFKQFDRSGDGKLTVEELGPEWVRKLNTSGDGYATLEQATGSFGSPPQAAAAAPRPDFSGDWVVSSLAKPSFEVCLSAGSAGPAAWVYKATLPIANNASHSTQATTQEKP